MLTLCMIAGVVFVGAEIMDTVHAEAQAMWDIRRLLTWAPDMVTPVLGLVPIEHLGSTLDELLLPA